MENTAARLIEEGQELTPQRPPLQPRTTSAADVIGTVPSRDSLSSSASWWRHLQCMGMFFHFLAPPRPPSPKLVKTIPSTISDKPGPIDLHFYLPDGYEKKSGWPVVVNFHGGGFTIGKATDDARFARFVMEKVKAVFVSVSYRLAPQYPFPVAVDDGADALLYLAGHANDLRLDPNRMATSGFSAGGNLALTTPLRVAELRKERVVPPHNIVAVATWYPITDYTVTREARRAASTRPELTLPETLTTLFDASYLFPPDLDMADPCLSPSKASDDELIKGLPPNVIFYTCEYDMLLQEGEELAQRLKAEPILKNVYYTEIPGVAHGWDKGPNPMKPPKKSERLYGECCRQLRKAFEGEASSSRILGFWKSSSSWSSNPRIETAPQEDKTS